MSEVVEDFKAIKAFRQGKRADNRAYSTKLLTELGIPFISKNNGAHLIVGDNDWDFYPGTGLFMQRAKKGYVQHIRQGRGVHNLIKLIKEQSNV